MSTAKQARVALAKRIKAVADEPGLEGKALGRKCQELEIYSITGKPWNLKTVQFENWWRNNKHLVEGGSEGQGEQADQEDRLDRVACAAREPQQTPEEPVTHEQRASHEAHHVLPVESVSGGPETIETSEPGAHEACEAHEAQPGHEEAPDEREGYAPRDDHAAHEAQPAWPDIEERMRQIARDVVQETMNQVNVNHVRQEIDNEDFPPEPETLKGVKGRKEDRKYKRFTISLDQNLARLFEADMERLRVGAGRMADIIFWRYYGKPALTYGDATPEPTEDP